MKSREYFILGSKLMGVWCLYMSLLAIGAAITTFTDPSNLGGGYDQILLLTVIVTRLIPIAYILAGFYLLKNGTALHNLAYPPSENIDDYFDPEAKFTLFLKLLGVYLVVSYFPDFLKSVSSYFTYTNTPATFDLFQQKQFAYINFIPSVSGIVLGTYLLKSGQFFIRFAFDSKNMYEKDE